MTDTPTCDVCKRRPSDTVITVETRWTAICDTCYQRVQDERQKGLSDDD